MAMTFCLMVCSEGHELRLLHVYCNGPDFWLQWCFMAKYLQKLFSNGHDFSQMLYGQVCGCGIS